MEICSGCRDGFYCIALAGQFWRRDDVEALEACAAIGLNEYHPWIVLDLERLTFISSLALGSMVKLHSRCSEEGGKIILFRPRSNVREVIEIADLPQFIAIASTDDELRNLMAERENGRK